MFALAAIVLFMLAAFGVNFDEVNIVYVAAACVAAHLLIDFRPWAGRVNA